MKESRQKQQVYKSRGKDGSIFDGKTKNIKSNER